MSIIANDQIARSLQEKLKDVLTCSVMENVLDVVKNILEDYEVTPIPVENCGEDTLVDTYLNAIRVEGKSEKTISHYEREIRRFMRVSGVHTRQITQNHIRQYLSDEKKRGLSDTTVRGECWCLSSYFNWLDREGIIPRNPMGNIKPIKVQQKVKEVFSDVDIERMKFGCDNMRDRAIVYFLKSTFCRIGEVVRLNRCDIDFQNRQCIVLGKGNKQRTVFFDQPTGAMLKEYVDSRKDNNPALFVNRYGDRIQAGGIRVMLNKISEKMGVNHVYPHKFRRTQITELSKRGMPIEQIKTLAGHVNISTTMGYIVIDDENVKNAYRKYA